MTHPLIRLLPGTRLATLAAPLASLVVLVCFAIQPGAAQATPAGQGEPQQLLAAAEEIVNRDAAAALDAAQSVLARPDVVSPALRARALWISARAHAHHNAYDNAYAAAAQALALVPESDTALRVEILGIMSAAAARRNNTREAFDLQQAELRLREEIGDPNGIAVSLAVLAELYSDVGLHETAAQTYDQALAQAYLAGDNYTIVRLLNNYAFSELFAGDADTSLELLTDARTRVEETGNIRLLAYINQNTGHALVHLGRYDEAEPLVRAALEFARDADAPELNVGIHLALARIENSRGNYDRAEHYAGISMRFAQSVGYTERISDLNRLLAEIAAARGEMAAAYDYLSAHVAHLEDLSDAAVVRSASLFEAHAELQAQQQDLLLAQREAEISRLDVARARAVRNGAIFAAGLLAAILVISLMFIREKIRARRSLEKKNRDLAAAFAEAERANRAKSSFLSVMSHELRTPLNAVIGFSNIIEDEKLGPVGQPDYCEFARHINQQGERLLQLVNDILLLTDAESGDLTLSEDAHSTAELFTAALSLVPAAADVACPPEKDADALRLAGDSGLLARALAHLVDNACKFGAAPVALAADLDTDGWLVLAVTDHGPGFGDADLDALTAPFVQADGSRTRQHEGAGLGLAVASLVARLHDGALVLVPRSGNETRIELRIPPARLAGATATAEQARPAA